ncbi:MAG: hypothetical protein IKV93_00630 [Alphaproteobacteria bacterium]|nr:hypothetical protein [Alphaproteobacteria bacterium]
MTSVGEWAVSSKPLTPSAIDIKQHTSVGSCASRYLPPQKIEGATIFISHSLQDIRELSLDELGQNYNATDHITVNRPIGIREPSMICQGILWQHNRYACRFNNL